MTDPRFAQRVYTLLSIGNGDGQALALQAYDTYVAAGGARDEEMERWLDSTPGTVTFVKLQRTLMTAYRERMRMR
jgi:hypothetical protein